MTKSQEVKKDNQISDYDLNALLCEVEKLISSVEEYVNYNHSGDPWEEDRRVMNEMSLDDLKRDGSLEKIKSMIKKYT